jgi:hypothetical protein
VISYQSESGRIWLGGRARLLDDGETGLKAWAEKHVRRDHNIKWMLGNYVEADRANSNGHIFPLADLTGYGVATIPNKPLNMLHHGRYIIGSMVAAEMVDPAPAAGGDLGGHPVVEVLSGMWAEIFPDEAAIVQKAHHEGSLFYSMECWPDSVTCPVDGCGSNAPWKGFKSDQYCAHMNASRVSQKILNKPHFHAGAAIVPPVLPGWRNASIGDVSALLKENADKAELLYAGLVEEAPDLGPREWERMMAEIMLMVEGPEARNFSQGTRKDLADKGHAMPDGSFPIENAGDLKNAIKLAGNAKDPAAAKAHIKRRAKALGLQNLIPDGW